MRFDIEEIDASKVRGADVEDDTQRFRRPAGRMRLGYVTVRKELDRDALARGLERTLNKRVELVRAATYTDLAELVTEGLVDLAWLPPAVYLHVRRGLGVRLAAMLERSGNDAYRSALLCRTGTYERILDVVGARAAWVDPWSAAGYLMPRALILAEGIDPNVALRETFVGSYDAALDALGAATAEIASGTCTTGHEGRILEQSWSPDARVRVLAVSSPIPSDVLCTTSAVSSGDAVMIESALRSSEAREIASALGGTGLAAPDPSHYDGLDRAIGRR